MEFRKAAEHWLEIAKRQHHEAVGVLSHGPAPQVFRAGDPVDRTKEAFIPRAGILGDLDQQLTQMKPIPMFQGNWKIGSQSSAVEQSPVGACQIFHFDDVVPLEDAGVLA